MKVKVFNLSYDVETGGFDSSELEGMGEEKRRARGYDVLFVVVGCC